MKDMYLHPTVRSVAAHAAQRQLRGRRPRQAAGSRARAARTLHYVALRRPAAALLLRLHPARRRRSSSRPTTGSPRPPGAHALPALGRLRRRHVRRALRHPRRSQVDAWSAAGNPGRFPIWGPAYLRFWVIRQALRLSPMLLLAGSPLYNLYLRALGARIGRNAVILTTSFPVCTDLVSDRRRHGDPQAGVAARLPGARGLDRDRPGRDREPTRSSARRPCSTSARRSRTERGWPTPPSLHEGQDVPGGPAATTARPAEESAGRVSRRRPRAVRARAGACATASRSWPAASPWRGRCWSAGVAGLGRVRREPGRRVAAALRPAGSRSASSPSRPCRARSSA